jgi:hypothetical protein
MVDRFYRPAVIGSHVWTSLSGPYRRHDYDDAQSRCQHVLNHSEHFRMHRFGSIEHEQTPQSGH